MKFELGDMYKYLLSHTFPGLLVLMEILLALEWFASKDVWVSLSKWNVWVLIIIAYAFSTLLGIIVDGIHHLLFEDMELVKSKGLKFKMRDVKTENLKEKFEAISDKDKMEIYQSLIMEDYWYPYEAYSNISIAMIPGLILLIYWFIWRLAIDTYCGWCGLVISILVYTFVFIAMFVESRYTYKIIKDGEKHLLKLDDKQN
jgi:hypothetical protein